MAAVRTTFAMLTTLLPTYQETARRLARSRAWSRWKRPEPLSDRWRDLLLVALVAVPVVFNAVMLWPEVAHPVPGVNDNTFHYLMIRSASEAIEASAHPLDSWGHEMDLGAARFLHYQNLPALFVIALDRLTLGAVGLLDLFNFTRYILLVLMPLTVFWSMRRMQFSRVASAGGAAASTLFTSTPGFGIEFDSYIWRGFGMYTQQWAIHLSFILLALLWTLARTGRGLTPTVLVASVLVLSHLLYAEMMVVTGAVVFLVAVDRAAWRQRLGQFALAGVLVGIITAFLWLSFLQFNAYMGESPYDAAWKLDSFGAGQVLAWLVQGDLLDAGRLPLFTVLLAAGAAASLVLRTRQQALAVALCVVWLVLFFGRSVWGPLTDFIPSGSMLLFHRFIGSFHLAAVLLVGVGFEAVWRTTTLLRRSEAPWVAGAICALVLAAPLGERLNYYGENAQWMDDVTAAYESDPDARLILGTLRALPEGRVYAGLRANWGENMRMGQIPWYRVLVHEGFPVVSVPLPSINLNSDLMFHFNEQDATSYDLFDVRYVVAPTGRPMPDFLRPLSVQGAYTLYRAPSSGAVTFASSVVEQGAADKLDLFVANRAWLLSSQPAAGTFIRWDYPADRTTLGQAPVPGCSDGRVRDQVVTSQDVQAVTECATPSTVVIKNTYHPNWRVTVDGLPAEAFMVSPSYIGVDVPAGSHVVRAEYRAAGTRNVLLAVGLATALGLVVASRFLRGLR